MPPNSQNAPAFTPEWKSLSRLEGFLNSATQIGELSVAETWECSRRIEEGALAYHALRIRAADTTTRQAVLGDAIEYVRARTTLACGKKAVTEGEPHVLEVAAEYKQRINVLTNTKHTSTGDLHHKTENAKNALTRLVESNVKLLIAPALSYCNQTYPIEDVVQEGVPILFKAANKFHYRRRTTFSTFAVPVISNGYIDLWRKGSFTAPPIEYRSQNIERFSEEAIDPESVFITEENMSVLLRNLRRNAAMDKEELHTIIAMHGLLGGPESDAAGAAREMGIPFSAMERVRARANAKLRAATRTTQMQNILDQVWQ